MNRLRAALYLLASSLIATHTNAASTLIQPSSAMGEAGERPVLWDFRLERGRGSGEWTRIAVSSVWEQQGFGSYFYGLSARGTAPIREAVRFTSESVADAE